LEPWGRWGANVFEVRCNRLVSYKSGKEKGERVVERVCAVRPMGLRLMVVV